MRTGKWYITLGLLIACSLSASAATFTVSKDGRGQFTSIQDAVDAAGRNDIVKILDTDVYEEQVDIDSTKAGLLLTSDNPLSRTKPTITWQDRENVYPQTASQASHDDSINFDQNGALRILWTRNITVDGIKIDGDGAYTFGGDGVWGQSALQHGNAAITLWISGDVTIRNCDITNAYIGINVKDRNEGGIFANANPQDLEPWNVVPLSGFGKTGSHLIEKNRIHNNSFGMFFESTWDLGSTVRYNLFYENFHQTSAFAAAVKTETSDGTHHTGGALWFKDHLLSPLSIHNNTFWHNYLIFVGHWRAAAQHLVFNNIYSSPNSYWANDTNFPNPFHKMDQAFAYRMKHSIYACQSRPPKTTSRKITTQQYDDGTQTQVVVDSTPIWHDQITIMNDIDGAGIEKRDWDIEFVLPLSSGDVTVVETIGDVVFPGAIIGDPFPPTAKVRWLETDYEDEAGDFKLFKSTDPTEPGFLEPDWDNPLVKEFIQDAGWEDAGIRDADGSIADLGAIPSSGTPSDLIKIKALSPVVINNGSATMKFALSNVDGEMTDPKIKYFRFIKNVDFQEDAFGGNAEPIAASDIVEMPLNAPVKIGSNSVTVSVGPRGSDELYAFFEMVIEGTGSNGETVTSTVGFLPYRRMEYEFEITVHDDFQATSAPLETVRAGDTVFLQIAAVSLDGSSYQNAIKPVEVSLNSSAPLYGIECDLNNYESCSDLKVDEVRRSFVAPAIFTRVPEGGAEFVSASGIWQNPNDQTQQLAFYGVSDGITILPGPAEKVAFQNPPSNTVSAAPPTIDPGVIFNGELEVYDRFENKVNQPAQVKISSLHPEIGNFVGGTQTIETGTDGIGTFSLQVTNGSEDDVFTLQGEIANKLPDQADMKVGKPLDKFWVFYSDTASLNPAKKLEGQVGERLPIQIWVSKDGTEATETDVDISITPSNSGLEFYSTFDAESSSTVFSITGGKISLWLTSPTPVENGSIEVRAVSVNTILPGNRGQIAFKRTPTTVESAEYFSTNGHGQVDSVVIVYKKEMANPPDMLAVYWPLKGDDTRKEILQSELSMAADNVTLSIKLSEPFPVGLTSGEGSGTSYDRPNPDVPIDSSFFQIADKVGPILEEANVYERFTPGNDTLVVKFSEKINLAAISGACFTLIKGESGETYDLPVIGMATNIEGEITISFATNDLGLGVNAPEEGDSLKILATGPVADVYDNTAHPLNQAVPVKLITKPVPVNATWYLDLNADGIVDNIAIDFAKNIRDLTGITVSALWIDDNVKASITPDLLRHSPADSSLIYANVAALFTDSKAQDRTGGEMDVTVGYVNFSDTTTIPAIDSAAPVISTADFVPGAIIDELSSEPDTLIVVFSEGIKDAASSEPFNFLFYDGTPYTMTLSNGVLSGSRYTFVARYDTTVIKYPSKKDSIWIAAGAIEDTYGNTQSVETNKRVLLNVRPKPYELRVVTGPNPFVPGQSPLNLSHLNSNCGITNGVMVKVDPLTTFENEDKLRVENVTIYDGVGNLIGSCLSQAENSENIKICDAKEPNSDRDIVIIFWDGKNANGRNVGPGTYAAYFTAIGNGKENNMSVKIGVKAQ